MSGILSYFTGRAAKAGLAMIVGTEIATGEDIGMTILGYVIVGALGGLINWASVYFKANKPSIGLY
jgi:hypothetical protein